MKTFNRNMETFFFKNLMEMLEMKNMISEVRNSLDGCNHRSDKVEDSTQSQV